MRKLALLLAVLASGLAFGQAQESVTINIVEVPVSVVDRAGNPVRGLTVANFELLDEGKARPITSFDAIDFTQPQSAQTVSALNPAARRNFMLVFDLSFSSPKSLVKAQEAARDFISTMTGSRDRVAISSVDAERGFRLLTAFTTDRNALLGAVGDPKNFMTADPLQIAGREIIEESKNVAGSDIPAAAGPRQQGDAAAEALHDINKQQTKLDDAYVRARINKVIGTLGGMAKMLDAVHGRKEIVLLSEGFDPKYVQGRDVRPSREQQEENDAASHGEIWNVDSDRRFGSAESMSVIDRMAQLFKRSDVVMHAIDIQGVRVQNDLREGSRVNSNEGLFLVAKPTGGDVFRDTNNLKSDFEKLLHQQEVVYVLAFKAPVQKAGAFHTLKVRLVDVPNAARVSHRPGYYESGNENSVERSLSNAQIILNDIPQADVKVAALSAPFPTGLKNAQVPVILEINGDDLIRSANGKAATAEVFVYAFDDSGLVRDSMFQRMSLDLDKIGDKLKGAGLKWYGTLSLPEGKYAVRSLVRVAETDKKGFVRTDVVVPRLGETAVLQPLFYDDAPGKWLMVKGASHAPVNTPYPFEVNAEVFVPMAAPHGGKFAVFTYNITPEEMQLETSPKAKVLSQVRGSSGVVKTVMQLENAGDAKSVDVTVKKKGSEDVRTASIVLR
ncbi:MAG TPA: VWA domain-containing protein [Thermoanaerobaculia bacterium]|nr:VWA domain-containing protein [Thermoanaerobaculia bacterium]